MRISQKMGIYNNMGILLDPVFANNDWESIIIACQQNIVPDTWAVGDSKDMIIGSETYPIDIIGKNHDTYSSGGTAPLTLQMHNCYITTYAMNRTNINEGGWTECLMRNTYLPQIMALMPLEVQNNIRNVNKQTSAGGGSRVIDTTSDKLFLLAEIEIWGDTTYSVDGEGSQYSYYNSGGSKSKKIIDQFMPTYWFTRSPRKSNYNFFCAVNSSAMAGNANAGTARGVAFAFCF